MKRLFLATALIIGFSGSALSTLEYSIGGLRSHAQDSAGARLLRLTHAAVPTEASPTEIIFWQSIQNGDDPADFNIYLEQYPDGAFAALARNRLKRLEATTTEFPEETIFWQSIQNGDDPADFNIYLEQYPDGAFAALARNRLKRLEATTTEFPEETISGIVVNKAEVENDGRLKSMIKNYFNKWKFSSLTAAIEMINVADLSVKSIWGRTFTAEITFLYKAGVSNQGESVQGGLATVKIEKTADLYKIISFDIIR